MAEEEPIPESLDNFPLDEREAVGNYEYETQVQLAAGYLRNVGIAAMIGKEMIPGLPFELALWVRRKDALRARKLLDDVENPEPS